MSDSAMQFNIEHKGRSASVTVAAPALWTARGIAFRAARALMTWSIAVMAQTGIPRPTQHPGEAR